MNISSLIPIEYPTDKPRKVYLCDDSPEGILSAVYDAWTSRYGHSHNFIQIAGEYNYSFFCEYVRVETDIKKAYNIADAIKRKISSDFYHLITVCLASYDRSRADDIYRLIILGFHVGASARYNLSLQFVQRINKIERNVSNERHHYMGFIRFEELEDNTLFARFRPKNNILPLITGHFADRYPNEKIIIADVNRKSVACINRSNIGYYKLSDEDFESLRPDTSQEEKTLQDLWKCFVDSIEIKERRNTSLQRNNMPLRFREFTPEFH
ncbi:MAG: DNA metabolism protein [Lachnospiraceae bacterium]|nr:DNA metabolism protein [Lachnospiraceae bacterium]